MGSLKTHIGAPFSIVSQGIRPESKREFSERQGGKSNCVSRSLPPCPQTCCQLSGDIYRLTRETRAVRGTPTKKPGLTKHKAITALFQRQNWGWAQRSVSLRSPQPFEDKQLNKACRARTVRGGEDIRACLNQLSCLWVRKLQRGSGYSNKHTRCFIP